MPAEFDPNPRPRRPRPPGAPPPRGQPVQELPAEQQDFAPERTIRFDPEATSVFDERPGGPPRGRLRRPPPPPPPVEAAYEPAYEGDEEEPEGHGLWYLFMAILLSLTLIAGGIYGLKAVTSRGYLDQYNYVFQQINLLPSKTIRPNAPEASLQVFLSDDGMTLTPHLQRLRRKIAGAEKDRLVLAELLEPRPDPLLPPTLPPGTSSRGFYRLGRMAFLDLTEAFLKPENPTPRTERLAVYSIVNSIILNNQDIEAVQILVEGKPIETAWGWLDCSSPLGADLSLIR